MCWFQNKHGKGVNSFIRTIIIRLIYMPYQKINRRKIFLVIVIIFIVIVIISLGVVIILLEIVITILVAA